MKSRTTLRSRKNRDHLGLLWAWGPAALAAVLAITPAAELPAQHSPAPRATHTQQAASTVKHTTIAATPARAMPAQAAPAAHHSEIITTQPGMMIGGDSCCGGNCGGSCGGGSCGGGCSILPCFSCQQCGEPMFWVRAEALSWWLDGLDTPALVTTSTPGTAQANAGRLGLASTSVLFGNNELNDDAAPGGRYAIGTWINPCRDLGIEFSYFHLESDGETFAADATTASIIARPFFNASTSQQDAELVVFPSVVSGSIRIAADTEFSGGELILQKSLGGLGACKVSGLFGYRFQSLNDTLHFNESITSISTASPIEPGTTFDLTDRFETENEFHGVEIGLLAELYNCNKLSLEMLAKIAIGNSQSRVAISGSTVTDTPSEAPVTSAGGFLALPSNSGVFEQDDFAVVPEIALRLNYQLGCNWQLQAGYTFIYWSDVARAGDQIDPRLNLSQLPPGPLTGPNVPSVFMVTDDFWAQGLNLGLQYDF